MSNDVEQQLNGLRNSNKPVLFLLPHLSLFESLLFSKDFWPSSSRKLEGEVFRPNRNPSLDDFIDSSRKAAGLVTFSRKEGLQGQVFS